MIYLKDFNVTVDRQKTEIKWFAVSFGIAFLLNIISIIAYKTEWSEIYSQILWVLLITCVIYGVSVALRILIYLTKRLSERKR